MRSAAHIRCARADFPETLVFGSWPACGDPAQETHSATVMSTAVTRAGTFAISSTSFSSVAVYLSHAGDDALDESV